MKIRKLFKFVCGNEIMGKMKRRTLWPVIKNAIGKFGKNLLVRYKEKVNEAIKEIITSLPSYLGMIAIAQGMIPTALAPTAALVYSTASHVLNDILFRNKEDPSRKKAADRVFTAGLVLGIAAIISSVITKNTKVTNLLICATLTHGAFSWFLTSVNKAFSKMDQAWVKKVKSPTTFLRQ